MVERGLKIAWAKATEEHMSKNPRDFSSATSADGITSFIEKRIDPKLQCVQIFESSIVGDTSSRQILTLILNQIIKDEKKDSTTPERKNTAMQTARGMLATLNDGIN